MRKLSPYYCKCCGKIYVDYAREYLKANPDLYKYVDFICEYCKQPIEDVPDEFIKNLEAVENDMAWPDFDHEAVVQLAKSQPYFDQAKYEYWVKCQKEDEEFFKKRCEESRYVPRCPICQSTDLYKISSFKKALNRALYGIYSADDWGKTYICNNCGVKF